MVRLCVCTLALSTAAQAQRLLQAVTPSALLAAPSPDAPVLGHFARGGVVFGAKPAGGGWLSVTAENGRRGYVQGHDFRTTLNAADTYRADPPPFINDDGIMGCPHLFIQAASLAARTAPSADAAGGKTFYTNDPVCVGYVPNDPEAWVRVEGHFEEDEGLYVQQKALGPRLRFDSVLRVYNSLQKAETALRGAWIARLVELAWKEDVQSRILALEAYTSFLEERSAAAEARRNAAFELRMSRAMRNPLSPKALADPALANRVSYRLGGYKTDGGIPYADLSKIGGGHRVSRDSIPECGDGGDARILYPTLGLWGTDDSKQAYLDWMDLSAPGNACTVAGFEVTSETTEVAFVEALGRYFTVAWTDSPHEYLFSLGDGLMFTITFRNGTPWRYEEIYLC